MVVYSLVKTKCDITGDYGYILNSKKDYEGYLVDTRGKLIAHDIIEHPTKTHDNLIVDELMALGAFAYFRTNFKYETWIYLNDGLLIANNIQSDLLHVYWKDIEIPIPPMRYSKNKIIKDSLKKAIDDLREEVLDGVQDLEEELHYFNSKFDKDFISRIEGWLAEGERLFKKRFQHLYYMESLSHTFDEIVRNVSLANRMDLQEFDLQVNFANSTVKLIEKSEDYN